MKTLLLKSNCGQPIFLGREDGRSTCKEQPAYFCNPQINTKNCSQQAMGTMCLGLTNPNRKPPHYYLSLKIHPGRFVCSCCPYNRVTPSPSTLYFHLWDFWTVMNNYLVRFLYRQVPLACTLQMEGSPSACALSIQHRDTPHHSTASPSIITQR